MRCLSPIQRPVHCTAWLSRYSSMTVTAPTTQHLHSIFLFLTSPILHLVGRCVYVCALCRNLQPSYRSSMVRGFWSGACWYRSGAATPTPTCTDLCVVCCSRYVLAVVSELPEAEGSEASRRVAAPQHDSYCIVISAMSSICCMSYLPNNFSHLPGTRGSVLSPVLTG